MKAGYTVIPISASDGDEALQVAANSLSDPIVFDMLLPKRSGPEVLRALKEDVRTAETPHCCLFGVISEERGQIA